MFVAALAVNMESPIRILYLNLATQTIRVFSYICSSFIRHYDSQEMYMFSTPFCYFVLLANIFAFSLDQF